jgi:hypothetical protein
MINEKVKSQNTCLMLTKQEFLDMPDRTFIPMEEKFASCSKISKDYLTLTVDSNAMDDFKLTTLLVNSLEKPMASKA